MSAPKDGGPAYPVPTSVELDDRERPPHKGDISTSGGMTKREVFAGQIMAALAASDGLWEKSEEAARALNCTQGQWRAALAIEFADSLLAELAKEKKE